MNAVLSKVMNTHMANRPGKNTTKSWTESSEKSICILVPHLIYVWCHEELRLMFLALPKLGQGGTRPPARGATSGELGRRARRHPALAKLQLSDAGSSRPLHAPPLLRHNTHTAGRYPRVWTSSTKRRIPAAVAFTANWATCRGTSRFVVPAPCDLLMRFRKVATSIKGWTKKVSSPV